MKKYLFVLAVLFLFFVPAVAAETECSTRADLVSEILETRYAFMYYRAENRRIAMDAVIEEFSSNGIDTSELAVIKDDFTALYDTAKTAADAGDKSAFNDAVKDGKDLVSQFKEKAREQKANLTGLREAIKAKLDENKEYLDGLHDDAVASKKTLYLKIFDGRVCHHQNVIDRISARNVDVSELQADLDAIKAKRDELSAKIDAAEAACDTPLVACTAAEADELRELHRQINDDFIALNAKIREIVKTKIGEAREAIKARLGNRTQVATADAEAETQPAEEAEPASGEESQ